MTTRGSANPDSRKLWLKNHTYVRSKNISSTLKRGTDERGSKRSREEGEAVDDREDELKPHQKRQKSGKDTDPDEVKKRLTSVFSAFLTSSGSVSSRNRMMTRGSANPDSRKLWLK